MHSRPVFCLSKFLTAQIWTSFLVFCIFFFATSTHCGDTATETGGQVDLRDCVIYHDGGDPASVAEAAETIRKYIKLSTGVELAIVNTPPVPARPMISLGENAASRKAGITADDLPWEASRLVTRGGSLYIVGRDISNDFRTPLGGQSFGTLYGAFAFLEDVVGVRWLMPGEHGTYVPEHDSLPMPALDRIEQPGLEFRQLSRPRDAAWHRHMRVAPGMLRLFGSRAIHYNHNWRTLFPDENPHPRFDYSKFLDGLDETFERHPEYFEMRGGTRVRPSGPGWSLCMSHPDIDKEIARRVGMVFDNRAELKYVDSISMSISPNDGTPRCDCEACRARWIEPDRRFMVNYNQHSSRWSRVLLDHFRNVAEIVAETHPGKFVGAHIYQHCEYPYEGARALPDNFYGMIAPVRLGYGPQRLNPEHNEKWHVLMDAWDPLLPHKFYYGLEQWLRQSAGAVIPPFRTLLRDTFGLFDRLEFRGAYFYGLDGYGQSAAANYMLAKLLWNPAQDVDALFEDFMVHAYGEGSREIKELYLLVEDNMTRFVQDYYEHTSSSMGYNIYPEFLRDVYAEDWSEIEQLYAKALTQITDEGARWRLEQLGGNLRVLYYHLLHMGMIPHDAASPLHMSCEDYSAMNVSKVREGRQDGIIEHYYNHRMGLVLKPLSVKAWTEPIPAAAPVETFQLRAHQEVVLYPAEDGPVTVTLDFKEPVDPRTGKLSLPNIPYYSVYDAGGQLIHVGLAENNQTITFPGEKGRHYFLAVSPLPRPGSVGEYYLSSNVPYALGDKLGWNGIWLTFNSTPLYFYVDEGMKTFELYFHGSADAEIFDPEGNRAAEVRHSGYAAVEVPCEGIKSGFWTIRFNTPFGHGSIRQDPRLSGYFSVDPLGALAITQID